MRKILTFVASFLLLAVLAVPASAQEQYLFDEAGLLSEAEQDTLNAYARQIAESYGCGIYMVTLEDYRDYDHGGVFDTAWNLYFAMDFGWGQQREGMLLLLSMRQRDYATFFYGENTEYAFDAYGQEQLEQYFLDNFGENDWYGGFHDYLETSEQFLQQAVEGKPVRESPAPLAAVLILIACGISGIVTAVFWSRMRTARPQTSAGHYITGGGLKLTRKIDRFTHQTRSVRVIPKSSGSSGSRAHSGGGGSGRSGKF